ncbi:hypothetical protein ABEB36_002634 [Hypothenemus hampei]|uniref:Uncharacterized protein n=1 Tax=Hypothenemus hampei TaxID=57062 RepID=A0ABD1F6G0_HYPHA
MNTISSKYVPINRNCSMLEEPLFHKVYLRRLKDFGIDLTLGDYEEYVKITLSFVTENRNFLLHILIAALKNFPKHHINVPFNLRSYEIFEFEEIYSGANTRTILKAYNS